ncbi:hypothetical protein PHO31112_00746 [Pandoraea horticolens]|uniref:Uncharacterized protein n=1 Tax=Pandoraea horticolens TaxID=2508298 RepID=A0A5E4SIF3_9BURK|nr:hypothetical protein [Pandoraea horticolens]VVD74224.1 hypothetical protein PHO31112_00746 [Pandoraea horticolens]
MNRDDIMNIVHAHSDLNIFGAIVGVLENGTIHRNDSYSAAQRIIAICNKEMQRLVKIYDVTIAANQAKGDA